MNEATREKKTLSIGDSLFSYCLTSWSSAVQIGLNLRVKTKSAMRDLNQFNQWWWQLGSWLQTQQKTAQPSPCQLQLQRNKSSALSAAATEFNQSRSTPSLRKWFIYVFDFKCIFAPWHAKLDQIHLSTSIKNTFSLGERRLRSKIYGFHHKLVK